MVCNTAIDNWSNGTDEEILKLISKASILTKKFYELFKIYVTKSDRERFEFLE